MITSVQDDLRFPVFLKKKILLEMGSWGPGAVPLKVWVWSQQRTYNFSAPSVVHAGKRDVPAPEWQGQRDQKFTILLGNVASLRAAWEYTIHCFIKNKTRGFEIVQQVRVLLTKPEDLSSIPRHHKWKVRTGSH